MRLLKLIAPLVLFVIVGEYFTFYKEYVQLGKSVYNWGIIPAFLVAIYYTFALTRRHKKNKSGSVALKRIVITVFVFFIVFTSFQGYMILYNCNIGQQTRVHVSGKVSETDFPKPKLLNKYTISVEPNIFESISFVVPTADYQIGQPFEKDMIRGSLGILYSSQ